ncbi:MAG: ferritin [Arachidicoccus sp.]|nr:ferritin [Arachidicoccus sp.]
MKTNRLSETIFAALNSQLTKEAHAAQIYLSLGTWADDKGYEGISNFLFRHANEERNHMMKFLEYILDRGAKPVIEPIPGPIEDPQNVQNCFNKVFEQEVENTTAIYKIVKLSLVEEDWATWNFLQWFVKEQIEEETLSLKLLDKIKIAGGEKATDEALQTLDKELEHTSDDLPSATNATQANP